jgi:hypothetical protein
LILGENGGWLEVVDINTSNISSTHKFTEGGYSIDDLIAIDDAHYLLAAHKGLLKTTKDQVINHYHKGKYVTCLCHITDSLLLVGYIGDNKLIVWDHQKELEIFKIIDDQLIDSIKRVMKTDYYILKTRCNGLKLLTINDLESNKFTV